MSSGTGRLFYVMGPSGAGKDSFMQAVREHWGEGLLVAHRYITRAASAGGENHIELSEPEFSARQELGLFALSWAANGQHYAVGREIESWLGSGMDVMVNGSREHLPQARARFAECLVPVMISVDTKTLERRLRARGRESEADIIRRLERASALNRGLPDGVWRLDNSGALTDTLQQFRRYRQALPV
ncbi:ribose 1,5-bisphosphokinase [Oceanisphaera sediminis]|uniref:Ribose 1,5-bisphosphate phosphokinase PhnN n=1 Tax=Oceanisphaera sediminis TaxID=981381 RepID=A0ABP7DWS4_9GAMM